MPKVAGTRSSTTQPKAQASVKAAPANPAASAWRMEANKWLGTPYRLGGQTRNGMDCSGFAGVVYRNVANVNLPRTTTAQYQASRPISSQQVRPGDLLFFNTSGKGVSHVGISLGGDQFVHASTSRGVIISSFRETYYAKTFLGVRRILP